ncbi:MAG: glycoside hydrolase family 11 protein, partial [Oscillospiraceae bacterium]|nr:glycoside hydrolase family 11 protein [Oscillospiraceae bacterium]
MKHTRKFICGFTALAMGLSLAPSSGLLSLSDVLTVKAADQQQTGKTADGYDYELWNQNYTGNVDMKLGSNGGFSCSWSGIENCLFRTGKKLGSTQGYQQYNGMYIDYDVDYQPMGNSYMCVYGWTEQPTVEYYIVEAWGDWRPPGMNNSKGTVSADGKSYDIYTSTRVNQPSIHGTETFEQYWSVNKTNPAQVNQMKNLKGTISVSDHFAAWERAGMKMGKMYEVALNIEGYRSSGKANVKMNNLVIGKGTPNNGGGGGGNNQVTPQQPVSTEKAPEMTAPAAGTGIATDAESSAGGWTARGESVKIGLTGAQKHGGSKSIAVTGRAASWNGIQNSSSELKAGGSYNFESYVTYSDSSYATAGFTLGLQYKLNGDTKYDNITDATTSAGKWAKLGDSFTVPAGAEDISLYIQTTYSENDGPADMINFYVDDISVTGSGSQGGSEAVNPSDPGNNQNPSVTPNQQTPAGSDSLRGKFADCFKLGTSVSPNELNSGA